MRIIAGTHKNRPIIAPKSNNTRPTSGRLRETLFNICQGDIADARVLDLFAGSGAMGLEALSRGAKFCTFIDNSKESVHCIRQNVEAMNFKEASKIIYGDVFSALKKMSALGAQFDIIYVDPPYEKKDVFEEGSLYYSEKILQVMDETSLLCSGGFLFIEDVDHLALAQDVLKSLSLISSRRVGRACLKQFRKT